MSRRVSRNQRTDYGTVLLHWSLVVALLVATLTGLRIASETPDRTWINFLDLVLPRAAVWTTHMKAAVVLIALAIAYPIYIARAGLSRRVLFDRVRRSGLLGRPQARWGAINVALYWMFYCSLLAQIVTGALLYLDWAGDVALMLHWLGLWGILGYVAAHVFVHWRIGEATQLTRILRPAPITPPPPPFDPLDLLDLSDRGPREASAPRQDKRPYAPPPARDLDLDRAGARGTRRHGPVVQSNPLVVAVAIALTGVSALVLTERQTGERLQIRHVAAEEVPVLDGETSDPVWRNAKPISVLTGHGGNFDGTGQTTIEIRAVHDGHWAYFLFTWNDPTRSLKQLPLQKMADGWKLLHDGYAAGDEHAYNEDKFSVLLTKLDVILAGDRSFHASAAPADGRPHTLSGRGLHYTMQPGLLMDVWQWKATSTNDAGFMDDQHFGPLAEPTRAQTEGKVPYRGGFAPDPGTAGYMDNFAPATPKAYSQAVLPRRLPKDAAAMTTALGLIDLDPAHGESDGARWHMTEEESEPFSRELNERIPIGTVVPGVILSGNYSGDRSDIRCAARWAAGRWALEAARKLDTGSPYDVAISTGTFMRVSAFDHAQIRHTRHVRPIRLEVE